MPPLLTLTENPVRRSPSLLTRVNFSLYRYSYNSKVCSLMFPKEVHPLAISELVKKVSGEDFLEPPATDSNTFDLASQPETESVQPPSAQDAVKKDALKKEVPKEGSSGTS